MVHVSYAVGTNRFHSIMMRCALGICDKGGKRLRVLVRCFSQRGI